MLIFQELFSLVQENPVNIERFCELKKQLEVSGVPLDEMPTQMDIDVVRIQMDVDAILEGRTHAAELPDPRLYTTEGLIEITDAILDGKSNMDKL